MKHIIILLHGLLARIVLNRIVRLYYFPANFNRLMVQNNRISIAK
jgi:cytochrome c oxidase assembly factor CtaG